MQATIVSAAKTYVAVGQLLPLKHRQLTDPERTKADPEESLPTKPMNESAELIHL